MKKENIVENYLKKRRKNPVTRFKIRKREKEILKVLEKFVKKEEFYLLDIGAADGKMIKFLKSNLNVKAIGIEPEDILLNAKVDEDVKIIKARGENLPFLDDKFDCVIVASVIEHVEDPERVLSESYRVLKKEGIIIVSSVEPFFDRIAVLLKLKPDDHLRVYNLKELKKILTEAGFKIKFSEKYGPFFYKLIVGEK